MKTFFLATCLTLLFTIPLRGQETIAVARDLYTAANYEDALTMLGRLDSANSQPSDRLAINQYRALCLLALGRNIEAERAIEAVVAADPLYRPVDGEASPRLRASFTTVRQRVLPEVVQREYSRAKAAYDREDFGTAAVEFDRVLALLGDPDLGSAASRPPLSDLRTLVTGFRDLSVKAVADALAKRAAEPPPPAPIMAAAPPAAAPNLIYSGTEGSVLPPVVVRQVLPPFPRDMVMTRPGVLELVISQYGDVESAIMRTSINPRYDAMVLSAARAWKYQPARLAGVGPVRFRKLINITLKSGS
jgi:hypothetical protein